MSQPTSTSTSTSTSAGASAAIGGFTPGEVAMLVECLKCVKGDISSMIDFERVALNLGFKGAKSARDRFGNIRRAKFAGGGGVVAKTEAPANGVDKKAGGRKRVGRPRKVGEMGKGKGKGKRVGGTGGEKEYGGGGEQDGAGGGEEDGGVVQDGRAVKGEGEREDEDGRTEME